MFENPSLPICFLFRAAGHGDEQGGQCSEREKLEDEKRRLFTSLHAVKVRGAALQTQLYDSRDLHDQGMHNHDGKRICERCLQPVNEEIYREQR